jgi:hypothetical protein
MDLLIPNSELLREPNELICLKSGTQLAVTTLANYPRGSLYEFALHGSKYFDYVKP